MKCPACNSRNTRVLETRERSSGIVARRHLCNDCGKRHTTFELPADAVSNLRWNISDWERRSAARAKSRIAADHQIQTLCEARSKGVTCADLAIAHGISVHMAYYFTRPANMKRFGFEKTEKRPTSKVASPWAGLLQ